MYFPPVHLCYSSSLYSVLLFLPFPHITLKGLSLKAALTVSLVPAGNLVTPGHSVVNWNSKGILRNMHRPMLSALFEVLETTFKRIYQCLQYPRILTSYISMPGLSAALTGWYESL